MQRHHIHEPLPQSLMRGKSGWRILPLLLEAERDERRAALYATGCGGRNAQKPMTKRELANVRGITETDNFIRMQGDIEVQNHVMPTACNR